MADTKISALPAISAVLATSEFASHESGSSAKATAEQIAAFLATLPEFRRTPDYRLMPGDIPQAQAYPSMNPLGIDSGSAVSYRARGSIYAGSENGSLLWLVDGSEGFIWRGNAAGRGGFRIVYEFGKDGAASSRRFIGVHQSSDGVGGPTDVPSNRVNCFGVGYDGGASNLHLLHNDGSGTCTATDLGSDFPVSNSAIYRLTISCEPNGDFEYLLERLDTSVTPVGGTVTTNVPVNTTPLCFHDSIQNHAGSGETMIIMYEASAWLGAV